MHLGKRHKSFIEGVDVMSMRSDHSFPRHTHEEFSIGVMMERGHECWCCRGLVAVQTGDVIGINPGELHDGIGRKGQPRAWHMITVSQSATADLIDDRLDSVEFSAPVFECRQVSALVKAFLDTATHPDAHLEDLTQQLRLVLERMLCFRHGSTERRCANADVQQMLEQIHSEWAEPLSLERLAKTAGLSKSMALRSFSQQVGTTPYAYLIQHRIKRARDMMLQGVCPAEAAIASGFYDQSHLTRAFKRQIGLPPKKFLNRS